MGDLFLSVDLFHIPRISISMSIPFEIHAPAADKPEALYTTLREGFQSAGYTRAALCAHLELRSFTELFEGRVLDAYSTLIDSPFTALC